MPSAFPVPDAHTDFANWRVARRRSEWQRARVDGGYRVSGLVMEELFGRTGQRITPVGWRWECELDRNASLLFPLHRFIVRWLWARRWRPVWVLVRMGFWRLSEEGGYYRDGRWCWQWWLYSGEMVRRFTYRNGYRRLGWWMRLGWWLQWQIDEFNATMPSWSE